VNTIESEITESNHIVKHLIKYFIRSLHFKRQTGNSMTVGTTHRIAIVEYHVSTYVV